MARRRPAVPRSLTATRGQRSQSRSGVWKQIAFGFGWNRKGILMAVLEKAATRSRWTHRLAAGSEPMRGAFFWLSAFYIVYCARPEDWIPGLKYIPLAKVSGIFAVLGLVMSAGNPKRGLRNLPKEAAYLAA